MNFPNVNIDIDSGVDCFRPTERGEGNVAKLLPTVETISRKGGLGVIWR